MAKSSMFCPNCGTVGAPKTITKGSFLIEFILWLAFLIPGLIYSIWRLSSRYQACPACKAPNMIPTNSPLAVQVAQRSGNAAQAPVPNRPAISMIATKKASYATVWAVVGGLCGLGLAGALGAALGHVPGAGMVLFALLVAGAAIGWVGRYLDAAPPWSKAYSVAITKQPIVSGAVASFVFVVSLVAMLSWQSHAPAEQSAEEAKQQQIASQAQALIVQKLAEEQREQQLAERFKKQKDNLFSMLESVRDLIDQKEVVAATVAHAKLGGMVAEFESSAEAKTLEYDALVRGLNSNGTLLEDLVAERNSEFEAHVIEAGDLVRERKLDEAEQLLAGIEQDLAPLAKADEMRLPMAMRGLRERVQPQIDGIRNKIVERRNSYDLRERIILGGYAYVVRKVRQKKSLGNWIARETAGDGATFLIVEYSIENLGSETETVMADDFEVEDSEGRKYRASSGANTALAMSGGAKDLFASELHPGVKKKMSTAFEVPKAMLRSGFTIIIPEKGLFGTGKAKIGLLVLR